jgi:RNA polymerase-binding transcription factor DksA
MLDVEFLLFRHAGSGRDAVLHRRDDGRLGLAWYGPAPERLEPIAPELVADLVAEPTPPTSSLSDALERLEAGGEAHVAVTDATSGRPMVVHRRWDGNYGVVTPCDEPAPPVATARSSRRLIDELHRLESVRTALRGEGLDAMTECEDLAELSGADQHPADLGTETFERTRDLSLLHEVEAELDGVRHALRRLGDGTYGRCEACGDPIPDERLAALPAARLCVLHESAAEKAAANARSGVPTRR